jgi:TPR repeat protein
MVDHAPRYPSNDPDIEHDVERHAEKSTSHSVAPYQLRQSARASHPERSVPLFVSDRDGVPDPSEYVSSLLKGQGSYYASRILAGALGGIALAGLAALASSETARDFFASAKASSVAAFSVASVTMQPGSTPSKIPAEQQKEFTQPSAAENQAPVPESVAGASAASGSVTSGNIAVAAVMPAREDVKAAYQGALQGSGPQAAAPPEPAIPADVIHHLDAGEIAALVKRAEALIGSGDLAAARLVLRRAAEAGDARAAMMLGGTYDPTVLEKLGVRGVVPDFAIARSWYEKAKRFGASNAALQPDLLAKKQN